MNQIPPSVGVQHAYDKLLEATHLNVLLLEQLDAALKRNAAIEALLTPKQRAKLDKKE